VSIVRRRNEDRRLNLVKIERWKCKNVKFDNYGDAGRWRKKEDNILEVSTKAWNVGYK
jgi:hypothetical protein